jgi:hypothetical protein
MREASGRGNRQLVHHWGAAFTEALTHLDIRVEPPASCGQMFATGDATTTRQAARSNRVLQHAPPGYGSKAACRRPTKQRSSTPAQDRAPILC